MSDRLRKFFRLRGKTSFVLDEVVAPVVLVQDLTEGPYQAGVAPAAGTLAHIIGAAEAFSFAVLLNDKSGSLTPVLDRQFDGRSFSFTWAEIRNFDVAAVDLDELILRIVPRATVVAAGVPSTSSPLKGIQENDSTLKVPVEIFAYRVNISFTGSAIWQGTLGDNTNTAGTFRTFEDIQPNITIGPDDALVWSQVAKTGGGQVAWSLRGFYQEQPA